MKVTPSALVNSLSGKTGGVVGARWKGVQYVRKHVIPANPKSTAQTAVRNALAKMAPMFRTLIPVAVAWNKTYGSKVAMTAFNVFTKGCRTPYQAGTAMAPVPPNALVQALTAFAAATGAGAAGTLAVTWSDTVIPGFTNVVLMAIKHAAGTVFEGSTSTTLQSAHAGTISGLTAGTSYDVYGFLYNPATLPTRGNMGTSAMSTATSHA